MNVPQIMVEALALSVGSLFAAGLFCRLCWTAFKVVHRPELGVPIVLVFIDCAFRVSIAQSEFLRMALAYSALIAVALWFTGLEWRRNHAHSADL